MVSLWTEVKYEQHWNLSLQLKGERNYHIFYRILAGMNSIDLAKLHLVNDPWKYSYLTKVRKRGGEREDERGGGGG